MRLIVRSTTSALALRLWNEMATTPDDMRCTTRHVTTRGGNSVRGAKAAGQRATRVRDLRDAFSIVRQLSGSVLGASQLRVAQSFINPR